MKKVEGYRSKDDSATDSQESDIDCRGFKTDSKQRRNSNNYFKNIKIKGYDTPDALPDKLSFTWIDIIGIIISICSFFGDVVIDIMVAYVHYQNGNKTYFNLTLAFIAIPSLAMTGFSLRWYLDDADSKKLPPVSPFRWVVRVIFLLLQMGPVLRYIDSLYYGLLSNRYKNNVQKQTMYYKQMIYEDADATLLRLFECFLESAPQLLLQLYIYAQPQILNAHSMTGLIQLVSMFTSLLSMAWALASYQRALRYSLDDKKNMNTCGTLTQMLWRFFELGSRMLALGLFASLFPIHMTIVCTAHYIVMVIWILIMRTDFCENKCDEYLYNAVLGIIFLFCYFNPKDTHTRRRYTFYYICTFLENAALMSVWFMYTPAVPAMKYPAMVFHFLGFALGIAIMIIYYLLLHPSKNISIWAHWRKSRDSAPTGSCGAKEVVTIGDNAL